jgi:hypothetical protein
MESKYVIIALGCLSMIIIVSGILLILNKDNRQTPITTVKINKKVSENVVPITFLDQPLDNNVKLLANKVNIIAHSFNYGTIRDEGSAVFDTTYFTFSTMDEGVVICTLKCSGKWLPKKPQVGNGASILPIKVNGDEITFDLPGPNIYYYHANIESRSQESICYIAYDPKDVLTPPKNARIIKGVNRMKEFNVADNETVFMEPGSLVICNADTNDVFLKMGNNSKLIGAGIVDTDNRTSNICKLGGTNIQLIGVTLRRSKSFGYVVSGQNVIGEYLKIFSGVDGADPIGCKGYVLRKSNVIAVDDVWAVKSHRGAVTDVLVEDCLCQSRKSAFKLGTESTNSYNKIIFKNCTLLNGCRFIALYLIDGGSVTGLQFVNLKGYLINWPNESRSGRWIDCEGSSVATIKREGKNSPIYDCLIKDCSCWGVTSSLIAPTGQPTNIRCENLKLYPVTNSVNLYNVQGDVNFVRV